MRRASWWRRLLRAIGAKGPISSPGPREAEADARLLAQRTIVIEEPIERELAAVVVAQLLWLESVDAQAEITLRLNSEGGSAVAALEIHDAMMYLRSPVAVVCTGLCAGVAALLLASGRKGRRSIVAHGALVLGSPRRRSKSDGSGAAKGHVREHVHQHFTQLLSLYTGKLVEQLELDCEQERRFSALEARDYGLVDHVLSPDD